LVYSTLNSEIEQLPAIWDFRQSSYRNKPEKNYVWEALCKKLVEKQFFSFYNSLVQQWSVEGQQRTIEPSVEKEPYAALACCQLTILDQIF